MRHLLKLCHEDYFFSCKNIFLVFNSIYLVRHEIATTLYFYKNKIGCLRPCEFVKEFKMPSLERKISSEEVIYLLLVSHNPSK